MAPLRSNLARVPLVGPALFDTVRAMRRPAAERTVRADLAETRRSLAWLREAVAPRPTDQGTLLILSLSDMVYQLKLEAMLGAGLRLAGWRVQVLTDSPANMRAQRYFRAFGIDDFVYLDDFAETAEESRRCAQAAEALLAAPVDFPTVKGWTFEGAWAGPQILSAVSRAAHEGAPDPARPEIRAAIAALLPGLLRRILVARRLIAAVAPDLGLVIEANDYVYGPFVDQAVASGVSVIQVTQPWRDDALTMRRLTSETRRMHPSSVAPETLDALCRRPWTKVEQRAFDAMFADRYGGKWFLQARNQPETRAIDRAGLVERLTLRGDRRIAVVFSHVLWDANLFYGEDLFEDYGHWFVETARAAAANPEVDWLIKMHPANLWKRARDGAEGEYAEIRLIREHIGALPPHVHLLPADCDINTLSLFVIADYGITVRGTSGMEMPCFGKPTLTAGTGRYSGLGFTVDSVSREDYLQRLAAIHELKPLSDTETARARWHAYAAFVLRPWQMQSFRSQFDYEKRGAMTLDHNLVCTVSGTDALQRHGDLRRWATWADSDEVDYLESAP